MEIPHRAQNQICTGTKPETHSPCSYLGVCLKDQVPAVAVSLSPRPVAPSSPPPLLTASLSLTTLAVAAIVQAVSCCTTWVNSARSRFMNSRASEDCKKMTDRSHAVGLQQSHGRSDVYTADSAGASTPRALGTTRAMGRATVSGVRAGCSRPQNSIFYVKNRNRGVLESLVCSIT